MPSDLACAVPTPAPAAKRQEQGNQDCRRTAETPATRCHDWYLPFRHEALLA